MGGDEFCALLIPGLQPVARLVEAPRRALSEHGEGFSVDELVGLGAPRRGGADPSDALRLADQRMYARKRAAAARRPPDHGRAAARARRAPPRPRRPLCDVALLAETTRRASASTPTTSRRSARPPSCTTSARSRSPSDPAQARPLDDDEWAFMRRHS
jgi:hypothetical protein